VKFMKIIEVSFSDHELQWSFESIRFDSLTLLVGISGVGKTRILTSIRALRLIASGRGMNGVEWNVKFTTLTGDTYRWTGRFETIADEFPVSTEKNSGQDDDDEEERKPNILRESLYKDEIQIIDRDSNGIRLRGVVTPKLKPYESIISSLSGDEDIHPAYTEFKRIYYSDQSDSIDIAGKIGMADVFFSLSKKRKDKTYHSLSDLQEASLPKDFKLSVLYDQFPDVFSDIKEKFIEIFPQVEDILFQTLGHDHAPEMLKDYSMLHIKEVDVVDPIPWPGISSGMCRVLRHISDLYLRPPGSVVLIDEFENSLGINCIDVLTKSIVFSDQDIQFIMTSHHPYIINAIDMVHWKIVTRKGGVVTVKDATDPSLHLGKSKHQAFLQLVNLSTFREGISIS
jgi:AAA domain, putative AbiEii toxin, Type IV TA system